MATETTVTYLQLISQDEKKQQKEELAIKAQEASIEVQREIMNLNSQIAARKSALKSIQRQIPYNVKQEYRISTELKDLEEGLAFVKKIKEERFSDISI